MMKKSALAVFAVAILAACSQTAEKIETAANRSTTSWALGKPYSQVAQLGNRPIDQLAADNFSFGQMIGQTPLADGSIIYRHIAPGAETSSGSTFGGIVDTGQQITNYRLSYFKVGQDGVVRDWATGSVPGTISKCISYIGGIFRKCEDQGLVSQALGAYDNVVRTSSNQPLSSWGPTGAPVQSSGLQ